MSSARASSSAASLDCEERFSLAVERVFERQRDQHEGDRAPHSGLGHLLLIGVFADPVLQDPHVVGPLALGEAAHGAARLASRRRMRAR